MIELRAPDPTLTAHDDALDETMVEDTRFPAVAHRWGPGDLMECGAQAMGLLVMSSRHARWFAVPCRECFPAAPEPGRRPCPVPGKHGGCPGVAEHTLAWQVQP